MISPPQALDAANEQARAVDCGMASRGVDASRFVDPPPHEAIIKREQMNTVLLMVVVPFLLFWIQ